MKKFHLLPLLFFPVIAAMFVTGYAARGQAGDGDDECVKCHREKTPFIVADWEASKHATTEKNKAGCAKCHGSEHNTAENRNLAKMPTARTCKPCHIKRFKEYENGKHALAWDALNALPMTMKQPEGLIKGMKGCGGCHRIGNMDREAVAPNRFSSMGCAGCHGRHSFSLKEARDPKLCSACHTGTDHPQWEMWSASKHGIAYASAPDPHSGAAAAGRGPSCQVCHFPDGDHENTTAWGFLAVRVPEDDAAWMADRAEILKAFGVIDAEGKPTALFPAIEKLKLARTKKEDFAALREKQIGTCRKCHAENMIRERFKLYDGLIREADGVFAKAIKVISGLYGSGIIAQRPGTPVKGYPFVLDFYEVDTEIEQKLFLMFEEYRMRVFQGAFHENWDYCQWRGWAKMKKTLVEIEEKAAEMRAKAGK